MKIHFNFKVDPVDAENILYIIREEALRQDDAIMEIMASSAIKGGDTKRIGWHKEHKAYLLDLITRMKHSPGEFDVE